VISTLRESFSATHNGWKAMIYNGEEFYESKRYDINPIIDRVGGGDSFSGGIIHGLLTKPNQGAALEFAVAASALKHYIDREFIYSDPAVKNVKIWEIPIDQVSAKEYAVPHYKQ
jgi:2-dehydro-3-deoxygluconokinase